MDVINQRGLTFSFAIGAGGTAGAVLAAGTTTTFSTTNIVTGCIGGKSIVAYAAQTNTASPTTDVNTAAAFTAIPVGSCSVFVWGVNAAGTLKVAQGSTELLDASGNFVIAPAFPVLPTDFCPFAYQLVRVGSTGSAWTFGTSNQATLTGVTHARISISTLPDKPQTS